MNRKHIDVQNDLEQQKSGEYAVQRNYRTNIIAAVICLVLAFVVWILVMGRADTDYLATCVLDQQEGYTYTLSVDMIEVEGTVADLRHADSIGVRLPAGAGEGEYKLSDGQLELELPDGIQLASDIELIVTVKAK